MVWGAEPLHEKGVSDGEGSVGEREVPLSRSPRSIPNPSPDHPVPAKRGATPHTIPWLHRHTGHRSASGHRI